MCFSSVNIKDPDTNKLSLAHFYRSCSIWPPLSIHDVLVPSTRPLVSTAAMTLYRRGSRRKLKLSARVSRLSYFSGQLCWVHIQISNDTHKTVRSLRLTLLRTTTMYRPRSGNGNHTEEHDNISSSYQTKRFVDEVSECKLTMAEPTTRGCASSRGWWAGVSPQERTAFTHSILIPVRSHSSINRVELTHSGWQISSARSAVHCAHRTPRRRLRHTDHHLCFCWNARVKLPFVRHSAYPHCINAICRSSVLRGPSAEHADDHA